MFDFEIRAFAGLQVSRLVNDLFAHPYFSGQPETVGVHPFEGFLPQGCLFIRKNCRGRL